jgi:hypothetical protein
MTITLDVIDSMAQVHTDLGHFLVSDVQLHLHGLLIAGSWMQSSLQGLGSVDVYLEPADPQAYGYVDGFVGDNTSP